MLYIISRTSISVANDTELIHAKNWANIIDHCRTLHLIVTKYASQNNTKAHLCHLSDKFVDKTIKILESSSYSDAKKHIGKVGRY